MRNLRRHGSARQRSASCSASVRPSPQTPLGNLTRYIGADVIPMAPNVGITMRSRNNSSVSQRLRRQHLIHHPDDAGNFIDNAPRAAWIDERFEHIAWLEQIAALNRDQNVA